MVQKSFIVMEYFPCQDYILDLYLSRILKHQMLMLFYSKLFLWGEIEGSICIFILENWWGFKNSKQINKK